MVIRVDKQNYFYNRSTYKRVEEYDPFNQDLEFVFKSEDGYYIHVDSQKIKTTKIGISFDFNGKTYIIDDNHQQVLMYAAYIINDKYDRMIESDINKGIGTRGTISQFIYKALTEDFSNIYFYNNSSNSLNHSADFRLRVQAEGKICFQTISNLVNTNKSRRELDLPYYPYLRGIDRYNAYYMTIWCTEKGENNGSKHKLEFDLFLSELISKLNENDNFSFSAKSLNINSRIIRVRDDLVPATI